MSTLGPAPTELRRRARADAQSPGVRGVLDAVGLAPQPVSTRAADRAGDIIRALGLGAGVVQAATGLQITRELGDRREEAEALAVEDARLAELERRARVTEQAARAAEEVERGLAARHAAELYPSLRERVARGELAVPEGADVAWFVSQIIAEEAEGQGEAYTDEFAQRLTPGLVSLFERQRTDTINQTKADTARALANAASSGERIGSVRASAARLGLDDAEFFDAVVRPAAELAGADVAAVERLAAAAPEQFGTEAGVLVKKAKAKRLQLDTLQHNAVRQEAFRLINSQAPGSLGQAERYLREKTAAGEFDEDEANVIYRLIGSEQDRVSREADLALEAAERQNLTDQFLGRLGAIASSPDSGGLLAARSSPVFIAAQQALGLSDSDIDAAYQGLALEQFAQIDATDATAEEKNASKVAWGSVNGVFPESWLGEMKAAIASVGSGGSIEMTEPVRRGYNRWRAISSENPAYARQFLPESDTRLFEMLDLVKKYVLPDDAALGIDNSDQALRQVMQAWNAAEVRGRPSVPPKAVEDRTGWVKDSAYNAGVVRGEVRRLAELYMLTGAPQNAAIEAASKNVRDSVQRVGRAYAYSRDLRLPDNAADLADDIVKGFAGKYGDMFGVTADHLALVPNLDTGVWQIMDVAGGMPRPLPTDLGGGSIGEGIFTFTPSELAAIAAGELDAPDYAADGVRAALSRYFGGSKKESLIAASGLRQKLQSFQMSQSP